MQMLHKLSDAGLPVYDGPIFDADTHIHEASFSFFKSYLPEEFHKDWLVETRHGPEGYGVYIGDRVVGPSVGELNEEGLMPPPGKLKEWLAAIASGKEIDDRIMPTVDMFKREARVAKLDEFGVKHSIMFPGHMIITIGLLDMLAQEKGPAGACAVLHAYNEYLLDEFGFADPNGRIYATPMLSLWDLEWAVKEAKWLTENGARIVLMPMGPAHGKAPANPAYDQLWEVLNDNDVVLSFHVSEATFMHPLISAFGEQPMQPRRMGQTAWQWMFAYSEIPVMMTIASYIYLNFFERFPRIRMLSAENGADWLPRFLYKMDKMRGMARNGFWPQGQLKKRPSAIFKEHCFVVAYPEDHIKEIVDEVGADCLLMGSDYPHAEGVPTPRDFLQEGCAGLSGEQIEQIMWTNGLRMMSTPG